MVQTDEPIDAPLHARRQAVVSAVLIGEQRVTALLRHLDRIEQRGPRGDVEVRVVGMEIRAGVGKADRLAVLLPVGQDQDVRMLRMMELVDDVRLGTAELAREFQILGGTQPLAAEDEDLAGEERVPDLDEGRVDAVRFEPEAAQLSQLHPCIPSSCFMRAHASGGSVSRPAASARRKSSAKCSTLRADCWPPSITK